MCTMGGCGKVHVGIQEWCKADSKMRPSVVFLH